VIADRLGAPTAGEVAGGFDTADRVRVWLREGSAPREELDAVCRQIDVRRKLATRYGVGWRPDAPETMVDGATMAGVVALLLRAAAAGDDGWGLKGVNSALKALELVAVGLDAPALRAWALEVLDARTRSDG